MGGQASAWHDFRRDFGITPDTSDALYPGTRMRHNYGPSRPHYGVRQSFIQRVKYAVDVTPANVFRHEIGLIPKTSVL